MNPGVDTWLALASGRHVSDFGPSTSDPFSFASRPACGSRWHPSGWINQKWLAHTALAGIASVGGLDALFLLKIVLYLGVAALLVVAARVRGVGWGLALLAAAAGLAASRDWLEVRPADLNNVLVAVLLLLVTGATRRDPRALWGAVPLFALWCNLHGGFVYGLLVLAGVVGWSVLAAWYPPAQPGRLRWPLAFGVWGSSLLLCAAASPYRLANLTHPLEVSLGSDARVWRQISEWRPLLDAQGVGSATAFFWLLAASGLVFVSRILVQRRWQLPMSGSGWLDVGVVMPTVAMAFASRRFVPVAAIVLVPIAAAWASEVGARWRTRARVRVAAAAAAWTIAVVAGFWVVKGLYGAYLAPWPADAHLVSGFDRLTHSYLRPHGAMAFLTENRIQGRLFAAWEETGFVVWAQTPDPASGRIPMPVLIDGRAQEAFPAQAFQAYLELLSGGSGHPSAEAMRAWIERRLDELEISVVLITPAIASTPFSQAVFNSPHWQVVRLDEHHTVLASRKRQTELIAAVNHQRVASVDPHAAALTQAYLGLRRGDEASLDFAFAQARAAHEAAPSARAVGLAAQAATSSARPEQLRDWLVTQTRLFFEHRPELLQQHGFHRHLAAAQTALGILREDAIRRGDADTAQWAESALDLCSRDEDKLRRRVLW